MNADELLDDLGWLRRLAHGLAGDDADDLVQETWLAAWRKRPDASRSLRPWLYKVMRDTARMQRRASTRREAREQRAELGEVPVSDSLLARARLHRELVELVLALDEPFRTTILMVFVDGRTSVDIARATGVPEGTVRWRLKEALARLRAQLDAKHGRNAWMAIVLARGAPVAVAMVAAIVIAVTVATFGVDAARGEAVDRAPPRAQPRAAAIAFTPHASAPARAWWEATGKLHPIRGRVVSAAGEPIAGAAVELVGWRGRATDTVEARTTTDDVGAFGFQPRDGAMYTVTASAPGHAGRAMSVDPRAPAREVDPEAVEIVLADCDVVVDGTIRDNDGHPITGATVRACGGEVSIGAAVQTDANGRYAMCADPGAQTLVIGARGYGGVRVALAPHVDVTLAPEARITGRVIDADTGAPVDNAQVFVSGDAMADRATLSATDGRFELTGVADGHAHVHMWAADHVKLEDYPIDVVAGQTIGPIELAVPAAATVSGRVVSNGQPVSGASVEFELLPRARSLRAVTDDTGAFTAIDVVRAPDVRVRVRGANAIEPATIDTSDGDVSGVTIEIKSP